VAKVLRLRTIKESISLKFSMKLLGQAKLLREAEKHGDAKKSVNTWIEIVKKQEWNNVAEVKQT
jgi:hypothetical protein